MPAPHKKTIIEWFGRYFEHEGLPVESTAAELAKKIKETRDPDKVLDFANGVLRGHGIESIRGEYHVDNYYYDIVALYVNHGRHVRRDAPLRDRHPTLPRHDLGRLGRASPEEVPHHLTFGECFYHRRNPVFSRWCFSKLRGFPDRC
jgi:hypothetical protein